MDNDGVVSFPFNFLISQHWNSSLFRRIKSSKSRIPTTDEDLDMFPHWNQLYFLKKSYISIKIKPIQPSGQRWSRFVSLSCFEISTLKFFFGGFFLCFFIFIFSVEREIRAAPRLSWRRKGAHVINSHRSMTATRKPMNGSRGVRYRPPSSPPRSAATAAACLLFLCSFLLWDVPLCSSSQSSSSSASDLF